MEQEKTDKRLTWLIIIIAVMFVVLLGRLVHLQLIKGAKFSQIARFNVLRTTYFPAPRGEIKDRYGKVLAYDVPRLNVCAVKAEIEDLNFFCKTLAPLLNYSPMKIKKQIENYPDPYGKVIIKSKVDTKTMMQVAEIQGDLPGLHLQVQPVREYPRGQVACHIIGYVGEISEEELENTTDREYIPGETVGKDGIEKQYDDYLRGKFGSRQDLVDASGKLIKTVMKKPPRPGNDVYLTIDVDLQQQVEEILQRWVDSLSMICGEKLAASAIIVDVKTGEILVMASVPGFDPNLFSRGISSEDYQRLINREDYPLLNRAIAGAYPLASTFKLITASAALQEGICTRYSPFNCTGSYTVGNRKFYCFVKTGHGKIDFIESISESCDVTFYILGEKLGAKRLQKYSRQFGLGQKTNVDLPGEIPGLLPDHYWKIKNIKEPWYTGDTVNLAIGQGYLAATPLQLAVITQTIANEGKMYQVHLMKQVEDANKKIIKRYEKKLVRTVAVDPEHLKAVKDGMRRAVLTGTAKRLKAPISAAGKTGTAENFPCPENPFGRNHTWFTGFAPAYNPRIALVVFFERSGGYAGKRAVPIAREILEAYSHSRHWRQR